MMLSIRLTFTKEDEMTNDQKTYIAAVLQACEEYFADRADVWTEDGYWVQNEENRLLNEVSAALDILGYKEPVPEAHGSDEKDRG